MSESSFTQVNRRLEEERRAKYCGTASISISSLKPTSRATNPVHRHVPEPLERLYREEHGCRQEDHRHHAKATISQHDLDVALLNAGVSSTRLQSDDLPYLRLEIPSGVQLECLQGSDRIFAADEVFDGTNKHWVVDLFLDDLSDELKTFFVEEYEYQKKPDDGEFYCKIRGYQGHHGDENPFFERMWLGRLSALSKNRRHLLDQLFRHKKYSDAFDSLLAIPALFCGFRLTVVHEVISMRCDEPHLHYLKHILSVWSEICGGDYQTMRLIDRPTIERLQGTAPGAFSTDHDELLSDIRCGRILGNFSEQQRDEIWIRICNASEQCLIPSLFTFFEDRKFLSAAAGCMRKLTGVGSKVTIPRRLDEMFQDANQQPDQCMVQVSQTAYVTVPGDTATRFDLGCRQLWLAAFREFRELPADVKKKDVLAKARKGADETTLFEFASLANRLGFESDDLNTIMRASPDFEVAKRLLLSARKPGQYQYPDFEKCMQQVTEILATAQPVFSAEARSHEMNERCVEPPIRCGVPRDSHHDRDQAELFLPNILLEFKTGQARVTSFFIRRSVYLSYFGLPQPVADFVVDEQSTRHLDLGICRANPADRTDHDSEAHTNSVAQAKEQSKLDQLRELSRTEQAKLDNLRQLAQEQQDRLHQLGESVHSTSNEVDFQQDDMVVEVDMEDDQNSSGKELLLFSNMNGKRVSSLDKDAVEIRPKKSSLHPAKRTRRVTQFDFDKVQEQNVSNEDSSGKASSSSEQQITTEFRELSRTEQAKLDNLRQLAQEQQDRLHQLSENVQNSSNEVHENKLAQAREQSKLDQLRELSRNEQAKLDNLRQVAQTEQAKLENLRQMAQEQQDRLHQLSKGVHDTSNEADFRQDQMVAEVAKENNQSSSDRELVQFNNMNGKRVSSLDKDAVEIRPKKSSLHPAKRTRRVTQFDFDKVQEQNVSNEDSSGKAASSSEQQITIRFIARQDTGHWSVSDMIRVSLSDPSEVQRTAKKYSRKKFLLYDKHRNNLSPTTCFNKVTADGSNTILVAHESKPCDYQEKKEEKKEEKNKKKDVVVVEEEEEEEIW